MIRLSTGTTTKLVALVTGLAASSVMADGQSRPADPPASVAAFAISVLLADGTRARPDSEVPALRNFFARRRSYPTLGQCLTADDIANLGVTKVTTLMSRMRGVNMLLTPTNRPAPFTRPNCQMRVLLQGFEPHVKETSLDTVVAPADLAGMEVYLRDVDVPIDFRSGFSGSEPALGAA